jgi:hypothetical protein
MNVKQLTVLEIYPPKRDHNNFLPTLHNLGNLPTVPLYSLAAYRRTTNYVFRFITYEATVATVLPPAVVSTETYFFFFGAFATKYCKNVSVTFSMSIPSTFLMNMLLILADCTVIISNQVIPCYLWIALDVSYIPPMTLTAAKIYVRPDVSSLLVMHSNPSRGNGL